MYRERNARISAAALLTVALLIFSFCLPSDAFIAAYHSLRRAAYFCAQGESALPYRSNPRAAFENVHSLHALPASGTAQSLLSPLAEAHKAETAKIFHFECLFAQAPELASACPAEVVVRVGEPEYNLLFYVKTTHKLE